MPVPFGWLIPCRLPSPARTNRIPAPRVLPWVLLPVRHYRGRVATSADGTALRPLERRVVRLLDQGIDVAEVARRFRRSPEMIRRLTVLADLPRPMSSSQATRPDVLRPIERRVLRWREGGADYAEIGRRFRRSPGFMERIEGFARYKLHRS